MRILGLDFGSVRIGVAVSDGLLLTAQGLDTIQRKDLSKDIESIANIIKEYDVAEVVVGLPISMDGTHSAKTKETLEFIDILTKSIHVPVKTCDERLTTMQAERALLEGDMSRSKRKGLRDRLAAQLILQLYLDTRQREGPDAQG
jgi:putative holliday junction resolvase